MENTTMYKETDKDINVSANDFGLNCGQLYKGKTNKGKRFCAMLIGIVGDTLVFETKDHLKYFHPISELTFIAPYEKTEVL